MGTQSFCKYPAVPRQRRGGQRGRGTGAWTRAWSTSPAACTSTGGWTDDNGEVANWKPNLRCQTLGQPSINCNGFQSVNVFLANLPIELIQHISEETNRYYHQWIQDNEEVARTGVNKHANETQEKHLCDTTVPEIKAFLAVFILIGNNKRLKWFIHMEGFRQIMARGWRVYGVIQRQDLHETIHAKETHKVGIERVGPSRFIDCLCLQLEALHWQGRRSGGHQSWQ